jgi:3-oxoadipate enol-lactonase
MPRIRVSTGIELYYEESGAGPSLLLLEGVVGSWVWFKNVPALSRHFRVVALDNRGTGLSDKPNGLYTVEEMARETVDVIAALGLGRTHLMGTSLGGSIAQEIALSYPIAAGKLVLIGSTAGDLVQVPTPPQNLVMSAPLPFLSPLANFRRRMSLVLSDHYIATHPDEFLEIARRAMAADTPDYARLAIGIGGGTWPGLPGRNTRLWHPAQVLAGSHDQLIPVVNAFILRQLLPNARLHLFPGSSHLCNVEQADRFNELVIRFLLAP